MIHAANLHILTTGSPNARSNSTKSPYLTDIQVLNPSVLEPLSTQLNIYHLPIGPVFDSGCVEVTGLLLASVGSSTALISRKWYRMMRSMAAEPRKMARR